MKSNRHLSLLLTLSLAAGFLIAEAGARGTGNAVGQQRPAAGQRTGQSVPRGQGTPSRTRQTQMQRSRTQVTDQQRSQYRICNQSLEKLRDRSRDMAEATAAPSINTETVSRNQNQIREHFRSLEQYRAELYQGLSQQQRKNAQQRMRQLDQLRDRIQRHLNAIDQTIGAPNLDKHRLVEEARLTERATRAYQLHFHELGDEIGMIPE